MAAVVDPYKDYRFRLVVDGRTVMGATSASGLEKTTEPVVLEVGYAGDEEFEAWSRQTSWFSQNPGESSQLEHLRRDLGVLMVAAGGKVVGSYRLRRAWVAEFLAEPGQKLGMGRVLKVVVRHEGLAAE